MKFKFKHTSPDESFDIALEHGLDINPGSVCVLIDESENVVGLGYAKLHPTDNFNRRVGRKISAGRAIKAYIPRLGRRDAAGAAKRREVWEELFKHSPSTRGK